jgi:hypothetical protein
VSFKSISRLAVDIVINVDDDDDDDDDDVELERVINREERYASAVFVNTLVIVPIKEMIPLFNAVALAFGTVLLLLVLLVPESVLLFGDRIVDNSLTTRLT